MLSLGYKIAKEQYEPLPSCYSQELVNLVTAMLLKDDQARPSMSEILCSGIVQKHMTMLVQANLLSDPAPRKAGPFEVVATATAAAAACSSVAVSVPPHKKEEEKKQEPPLPKPMVSARESLKQRKEAENKKKFEEIARATKVAHLQIAMFDLLPKRKSIETSSEKRTNCILIT